MNAASDQIADERVPQCVNIRHSTRVITIGYSYIRQVGPKHPGRIDVGRHVEDSLPVACTCQDAAKLTG